MSDNRRNTFRCPTETHAILKEGRKDREVEMLDHSADGFSVRGNKLTAKVGQRLQLRTNRGWSEVEVARRDVEGTEVRLGLQHIEDQADPREIRSVTSNSIAWWLPSTSNPGANATLLGMLLLVGLCFILTFWGLVLARAWM
jgi:hypothetical protein